MATSIQQPRMDAGKHMLIYGEGRAWFLASQVSQVSCEFLLICEYPPLCGVSQRLCILARHCVRPRLRHKGLITRVLLVYGRKR
jgi:hypothetical protein